MTEAGGYDPRYLEGIALFNKEDFFEAHEVWEALWHDTHGEAKDFIQGLIQVTSAFHHFQQGNMRGARILHDSGLQLLAPYGNFYMGLDLKDLKQRFDQSLKEILEAPFENLKGRGYPGIFHLPYTSDRAFKLELQEASPGPA
jgi:uncharacterized protein